MRDRYNHDGYRDDTAYLAIRNIIREEQQKKKREREDAGRKGKKVKKSCLPN